MGRPLGGPKMNDLGEQRLRRNVCLHGKRSLSERMQVDERFDGNQFGTITSDEKSRKNAYRFYNRRGRSEIRETDRQPSKIS